MCWRCPWAQASAQGTQKLELESFHDFMRVFGKPFLNAAFDLQQMLYVQVCACTLGRWRAAHSRGGACTPSRARPVARSRRVCILPEEVCPLLHDGQACLSAQARATETRWSRCLLRCARTDAVRCLLRCARTRAVHTSRSLQL